MNFKEEEAAREDLMEHLTRKFNSKGNTFGIGDLYQRNQKKIPREYFIGESQFGGGSPNPIKVGDLILIIGVEEHHYDILRVNAGNLKEKLYRMFGQLDYWDLVVMGTGDIK